MTMTRDEAEGKLGDLIDAAYRIHDCQFNEQRDEQIALIEGLKQELLATLTTEKDHSNDGSIDILWDTYEEPDMSLDNTEKIEAAYRDIDEIVWSYYDNAERGQTLLKEILTKHFGGGKP